MAVAVAEEAAVGGRPVTCTRVALYEKLKLGRRRPQRRLLTEQAEEEGERRRR